MDETKAEKFNRIVEPRVNVCLDKIRLVKNAVGNKLSYDVTQEQKDLIVSTLLEAINEIDASFEARNKSKNEVRKFSF